MTTPGIACQTCKVRRIKCDGARPKCQRCIKAQRICLSTDIVKQVSLTFHAENEYASGRIKRPRGPRSNLVILTPHLDLRTRAVAYYLQHHLDGKCQGPNIFGGLSENIPQWKRTFQICPSMDLAISCTALVIFSRVQKVRQAAMDASKLYSQLLIETHKALASRPLSSWDQQALDIFLMVIFLMSRYEHTIHAIESVSMTSQSFRTMRSWCHSNGAMALLKVWAETPIRCPPTSIIKQTRRGILKFLLLRNDPVPHWMLDGEFFGENGPGLDFDSIYVRIVNLYSKASILLRTTKVSQMLDLELLEFDAARLDIDSQMLTGSTPDTFTHQTETLPEPGPWPKRHFYTATVLTFSNVGSAAVWAQYLASRMLIQTVRIKLLHKMLQSSLMNQIEYMQRRQHCMSSVRELALQLASSIPFCLERFTVKEHDMLLEVARTDDDIKPFLAGAVTWPLTIAATTEGIDPVQKLWFQTELAVMGKLIGDGVLEHSAMRSWSMLP